MQKLTRVFLVLGLLFLATSAGATTVQLSSHTNNGVPAELLDATYDFTVTGDQLRLAVSNLTSGANQFDIVSIFFNDSNDVADLDLVGVQGTGEDWVFRDGGKWPSTQAFGSFDYSLHVPVWRDQNLEGVGPGDVVTFLFDITCAGALTCDASDFALAGSFGGPMSVFAAGRFIRGPGGATPFGAGTTIVPVPEPATALLLGAGLIAISARSARCARRR